MKPIDFITTVVDPLHKKQLKQDAIGNHSYLSFLWIKVTDKNGVVSQQRFAKGASSDKFDAFINQYKIIDVVGPFKTKKAAI